MKWTSIIFIVCGILLIFWLGVSHEKVHQTIYSTYGIDSRINLFRDFPDMTTEPINQTLARENCNETCMALQMENEIVGYPYLPLIVIIFLGLLLIISELEYFNFLKETEILNGK